MTYELESNQLLTMLLKKIKGLKQVKLVEAKWVWTESHSRRLKLELTIQKEVMTKTLLQKKFHVEFEVINLQCEDCKKTFTPHIWTASV
jgi:nonsense-mediated mRNA decay protein 3